MDSDPLCTSFFPQNFFFFFIFLENIGNKRGYGDPEDDEDDFFGSKKVFLSSYRTLFCENLFEFVDTKLCAISLGTIISCFFSVDVKVESNIKARVFYFYYI